MGVATTGGVASAPLAIAGAVGGSVALGKVYDETSLDQLIDEAANTARPYILTAVENGIEAVDTVNGAVDALQTWSSKLNPLNLLANSN